MATGGFLDDGTDDDDGEVVVTFGMLRSDLVDMLSVIALASSELESIVKNNAQLSPSETSLVESIIENHDSVISIFSLGGEISQDEIESGARKLRLQANLMAQMQTMQEFLYKNIMSDTKSSLERRREAAKNDEVNPYLAEVYGDKYV